MAKSPHGGGAGRPGAEIFLRRIARGFHLSALGCCLWAGRAHAAEAEPAFAGPVHAGRMDEPKTCEASGLAPSRLTAGLLWTHDDSGGAPVLRALAADGGKARGWLRVLGVANRDWEDLASFTADGKAWLLIADTGDNLGQRAQVVLHVLEEPAATQLARRGEVAQFPAYSIAFVYEDGPRDCEAVAVAPEEQAVYLLTKRDRPARLYRLPLQAAAPDRPAVARQVGTVPHLPQSTGWTSWIPAPERAFRGDATALDFSSDGRRALVLTYGGTYLFARAPGESWATALAREPQPAAGHHLPQAEAACFDPAGRVIFVASEQSRRLLRYDAR